MKEINEALELRVKTMDYVIRDEDTDEIIGLREDAPDDVKADYEAMLAEENSAEPVIR